MDFPHSVDGSRHADREVADDHVLRDFAVVIEVHVPGRGEGGAGAEVESRRFALRRPKHQKPVTSEVSCFRVDHCQREHHGDGGVHRVPAGPQDVDTDLAGEFVGRDDHPAGRGDGGRRIAVPPGLRKRSSLRRRAIATADADCGRHGKYRAPRQQGSRWRASANIGLGAPRPGGDAGPGSVKRRNSHSFSPPRHSRGLSGLGRVSPGLPGTGRRGRGAASPAWSS